MSRFNVSIDQAVFIMQSRDPFKEYRDILYEMNEGFVILESVFNEHNEPIDFRFLEYNEEFEKQTGWHNIAGKLRSELSSPTEEKWIQFFGRIARSGVSEHLESEAIALGNYYEVRAFRIGGSESRKVAVLFNDISRQKEMEEAFLNNEQRWITTLSCIGDAVIATDAKKRITFINREAENLTGWTLDEVYRKPVNQFLNIIDESTSTPIDYAGITEVRVTTLADQLVLISKEGKEVPVDYTAAPILTKEGKNLGIVLIFRDVATRKRAEKIMKNYNLQLEDTVRSRTAELESAKERAESADRLKTTFLLNMSHELRTPLNSIIGFSGILLKQLAGPLNPEQEKQLGMILKSGRHLLSLINDILDISKIEAGEIKPDFSPFELPELISEVMRLVETKARNKGLTISLENSYPEGLIISDKNRLRQIVINLVFNAVKFTDSGEIKIKCWQEIDLVKVEVTDTGIGIRKEDMDKLFNPFIQLENSLTRKFEGSGLGLSISKKIIDMLHGTITVRSEFGIGTTFILSFPRNGNLYK